MAFNNEVLKMLREDQDWSIDEAVGELYKQTGYATNRQSWNNWESEIEPKGEALINIGKLFKKNTKIFYD